MKPFAMLITLLVASVSAHDKEFEVAKKWMFDKSMESCLTRENYRYIQKMERTAISECSNEPAPELELPFFKNKYSVATGIIKGAFENNPDWASEVARTYMLNKMVSKMYKSDDAVMRYRREEDEVPAAAQAVAPINEETDLGLGDRLVEKLELRKNQIQAEIGNMTCLYRKMGITNEKNEIQIEKAISLIDSLPQKLEPTLKEEIIAAKRTCYEFVMNLPESMYAACGLPKEIFQLKKFCKCMKIAKVKTCLFNDARKEINANFGSVEELAKTTKLEANHIIPLFVDMLYGGSRKNF